VVYLGDNEVFGIFSVLSEFLPSWCRLSAGLILRVVEEDKDIFLIILYNRLPCGADNLDYGASWALLLGCRLTLVERSQFVVQEIVSECNEGFLGCLVSNTSVFVFSCSMFRRGNDEHQGELSLGETHHLFDVLSNN